MIVFFEQPLPEGWIARFPGNRSLPPRPPSAPAGEVGAARVAQDSAGAATNLRGAAPLAADPPLSRSAAAAGRQLACPLRRDPMHR